MGACLKENRRLLNGSTTLKTYLARVFGANSLFLSFLTLFVCAFCSLSPLLGHSSAKKLRAISLVASIQASCGG